MVGASEEDDEARRFEHGAQFDPDGLSTSFAWVGGSRKRLNQNSNGINEICVDAGFDMLLLVGRGTKALR